MLRCVFHDARERIYDNLLRFATGKPRDTAAFMDMYIDRTEGRPVKKVEANERQFTSVFVLADKNGQLEPASPPRQSVGAGASPAASELSAVDALILGLDHGNGAREA